MNKVRGQSFLRIMIIVAAAVGGDGECGCCFPLNTQVALLFVVPIINDTQLYGVESNDGRDIETQK